MQLYSICTELKSQFIEKVSVTLRLPASENPVLMVVKTSCTNLEPWEREEEELKVLFLTFLNLTKSSTRCQLNFVFLEAFLKFIRLRLEKQQNNTQVYLLGEVARRIFFYELFSIDSASSNILIASTLLKPIYLHKFTVLE